MHDVTPGSSGGPSGSPTGKSPAMIWTRSAADLPADRGILDSLAVDVLHVPCLGIERTPDAMARLASAAKPGTRLVFTSQNAVRVFKETCEQAPETWKALTTDASFYTHGKSTAAALMMAFGGDGSAETRVRCVDSRTSEELARELAREKSTPVIWICGEEVAFDLTTVLATHGIDCARVPVYTTTAHPTDNDGRRLTGASLEESRALLARRLRGIKVVICFASPSAVRGWLEFAGNDSALRPGHIAAAVIGPTTARAAASAGFSSVTTCAWPQIADLAALGAQLAGR
ncbi:uroporphyrinogen-III synthase [bacterium]|nr:uroporphyrinogen-III synthase [bacterium]